MAKKVVEIFEPTGEVKKYRLLSERLPEFLAAYGPDKGYRVILKVTDLASIQAGLTSLYVEAIKAGVKPTEAGLPPMPGGLVFRATLIDKNGNEVANATSHRFRLESYKDFEKAETAARQRLLAALGFGGEILDGDETGDVSDQGKECRIKTVPAQPSPIRPVAASTPSATTPPPLASKEEPCESETKTSVSEESSDDSAQTDEQSGVTAAWLNRIKSTAAAQGIPVPKVSSDEEAKRVWKAMMTGKYKSGQ